MVSRSKKWAGVAATAAAALVLAGCAGSPAPGGTDGGGEATELASTGWERADRDAITDGGTLNLGLDNVPANWNLMNLDAGAVDDQFLSNMYLARYITMKEDGTWEPNKNYASSIELTGEDPQVVSIALNPEAVWSDGTAMTAADVIGTWTALNGTDEAYAPIATNVWEDIASVEQGATPQDVTITFEKKNADWPSVLGNIWPAWLTASPESFNTLWKTGPFAADGSTYVSGGPFIVTDFNADAQTVSFGQNPAWWGDKPKLDTINFKAVGRDTLGQAFANNEFDAISIFANVDILGAAQKRSDAEIQSSKGVTFTHVTLNGTTGVLADDEIRQAFAKSIDRQVIADASLKPLGVEPEVLNNLIFLPGQKGYEDNGEPIAFDLDAAKKQLEDAGWTGDGIREKDGQKLSVRLVIPADTPNSATTAQQLQPMVAQAGFDLTIDTVPSADFFTKYITTKTRDFEATLFAWQGTPFPISSVRSIYTPADSGQNFAGIEIAGIGERWDTANAELDVDARLKLADELDKEIIAGATTIPISARPNQYAVKTGLVNFGPSQFEDIIWENVGMRAS